MKVLQLYGVRLIANAICMWIQHLIYQLSAHLFRSTATRTSSIGDVFKTLALLQPIFPSIELDALLLADIFDGDIFRPMINSMKKAGFSDGISIRGFFACGGGVDGAMVDWGRKSKNNFMHIGGFRLKILPSLGINF